MPRVDADRILRRAGALIAANELRGSMPSAGSEGFDVEWAIVAASADLEATVFEQQIALRRVARRVGDLTAWTDQPDRTAEDVLAALLDALDQPTPSPHHKVIASIGTGTHEDLLRLVRPTFECYARLHAYDIDVRTTTLDPTRPVSWSKIPLLFELLEQYSFVFWIDSDAAIVDPREDLEDLLSDMPMAMVSLHTADAVDNPNMGVLGLRSCQETIDLLAALWKKTEYLNHRWWENAALLDHLGYEVDPAPKLIRASRARSRIAFIPSRWNTVPGAQQDESPTVVHYPGHSQGARLEHLGRALGTLMTNLDAQAGSPIWTSRRVASGSRAAGPAGT